MDKNPSDILINQAAQWYARLHAPDCSESERTAFKAWLGGDPAREQAYKSVIDAAALVNRQFSHDSRLQALASQALLEPGLQVSTSASRVRHLSAGLRYAAAAVVLVGVAVFFNIGGGNSFDAGATQFYANTGLSKQRIELADGSVVFLDVGASLHVNMSKKERNLDLDSGRAYFEVAHDKTRPFSVSKTGTKVVALGTRFQVEVTPEGQTVNVTLTEGSVAVTNNVGVDIWREVLVPGQQLLVDNLLHRRQIVQVKTDAVTSWSTGFLVFDGVPLRKALEEVNRYSDVKVVLGDTSLGDIPIAGNFIAGGDSSDFVATLTAVLALRSARTGANEIVLFEKYDTQNL